MASDRALCSFEKSTVAQIFTPVHNARSHPSDLDLLLANVRFSIIFNTLHPSYARIAIEMHFHVSREISGHANGASSSSCPTLIQSDSFFFSIQSIFIKNIKDDSSWNRLESPSRCGSDASRKLGWRTIGWRYDYRGTKQFASSESSRSPGILQTLGIELIV